jgi:methylenetetrahydrofolate reductase (NADPH)
MNLKRNRRFRRILVIAMYSLNVKSQPAKLPPQGLYALEVTAKDIEQVVASKAEIPPGTPINIAFLGNEDHPQRVNAARVIRQCGFEPVPIISSRRLRSEQDRDNLLGALIGEANPTRFILVGGDPATPAGPYADSLALLKSGVLERHTIRQVGIVAYPEGHPKIDADTLWRALSWKHAFLKDAGCTVEITTQFGFDADAIVRWIERLRAEGINTPVRIGVPGPADVGKLLRYARQFGVITSAGIVRRYGLSLTNLLQRVGPDRFVERLALGLAGRDFGAVLYHLYPFGGIAEGVRWMSRYLLDHNVLALANSHGK